MKPEDGSGEHENGSGGREVALPDSGGREVAPPEAEGDRAPPRSYGPKECGSCRLWKPILEDHRGPIGPCLLKVRTGDFPGTAPACERYLSRAAAVPSAPPPEPVRRRAARPAAPTVHPARPEQREGSLAHPEAKGGPAVYRAVAPSTASPLPEELTDMTREEFAQAIREALREEEREIRLAPKWEGGSVVLKPGDPGTQPKEIPLDALLHKVVMIRDRLRVLEQKINAHGKLTDAEKVDMQQYITRCYGSLTTFNLLFREEKDRFVGEKGA